MRALVHKTHVEINWIIYLNCPDINRYIYIISTHAIYICIDTCMHNFFYIKYFQDHFMPCKLNIAVMSKWRAISITKMHDSDPKNLSVSILLLFFSLQSNMYHYNIKYIYEFIFVTFNTLGITATYIYQLFFNFLNIS